MKHSAAKGSRTMARRQPGMASTSINKSTNAGQAGNPGTPPGNTSMAMLSGAESGSTAGNAMLAGTPNARSNPSKA